MTLEVLEGTLLDLGPEFWALVVIVALIIIELFQLGPHTFATTAKVKDKRKTSHAHRPPAAVNIKGGARILGSRKRLNHAPVYVNINVNIFQSVINTGEKAAVLYLGKGGKDLQLRPRRPESATEGIYPQTSDLDNFILARGEDAEVTVVQRLKTLWAAKDRTDARCIVLYSPQLPSTYTVQRIADLLKQYVDKVEVSVIYLEDSEEGNVEEKSDHLGKAGITLDKIK